jgi:hypothetical protein
MQCQRKENTVSQEWNICNRLRFVITIFFVCDFNDTGTSSRYIASNGRVFSAYCFGNNFTGRDRALIWGILPELLEGTKEKPRIFSVTVPDAIQILNLSDRRQKRQSLSQLNWWLWYIYILLFRLITYIRVCTRGGTKVMPPSFNQTL